MTLMTAKWEGIEPRMDTRRRQGYGVAGQEHEGFGQVRNRPEFLTANGKPQRRNEVSERWSNGLLFTSLNHSALSSWPKGSQPTTLNLLRGCSPTC